MLKNFDWKTSARLPPGRLADINWRRRKRMEEQQSTPMQQDEAALENPVPSAKRLKRMAQSGGTSETWFGAASESIPGVDIYEDWKPPDGHLNTHSKTFYLELENDNYHFGKDPTQFYCIPPYYNLMWHALPWYLDYGEFAGYRNFTNWARIREITFQVNIVGHRLPFTTNEENSMMANSQVDQTLDVFRGVEKRYPHKTCYKKDVDTNMAEDVAKIPYGNMVKTLYGYSADSEFTKVPAQSGYRRWRYMPKYYTAHEGATEYKEWSTSPSKCHGWPNFANLKWQSADLRTFRGPIVTIVYEPKGGFIGQQPSILLKQPTEKDHANFIRISEKQNLQTPCYGLVPHKHIYSRYYDMGISNTCNGGWRNDPAKLYIASNIDMEYQSNTRTEPILPSYQSIFLGVRPQMNGSKHQRGIMQIEVRTQCVVEFQLFWAVPIPIQWKNNGEDYDLNTLEKQNDCTPLPHGFTGLSNDLDLMKHNFSTAIPSYTVGNKLIYENVPTLDDVDTFKTLVPQQFPETSRARIT